jgi:hypothetical protein
MVFSSQNIIIRIGWRTFMRRITLVVILLSLLFLKPGVAAPPGNDDTQGAYRLIFRGCYSGTGMAVVTPKTVTIRGKDVYDEAGNPVEGVGLKINIKKKNNKNN